MINRTGLTVSLDHTSFADLIRDADVSRSTAYRHWLCQDLLLSDLVTRLGQSASPAIIQKEIAMIQQVWSEHLDWLGTAQLRHKSVLN
jgi:hypothetical protein